MQDARSPRQLFALKRITCHSKEDEKVAQQEVDYMRMLRHRNLVPCEESERVMLRAGNQSAISEVNIVMPYYRVSWTFLCVRASYAQTSQSGAM